MNDINWKRSGTSLYEPIERKSLYKCYEILLPLLLYFLVMLTISCVKYVGEEEYVDAVIRMNEMEKEIIACDKNLNRCIELGEELRKVSPY